MEDNFVENDRMLSEKYHITRPKYKNEELEELRGLVAKKLSENEGWKEHWLNEDSLIRFLKAFENVKDALNGLEEYCNWRQQNNVDRIAGIDISADEKMKKEQERDRDRIFDGHYDRCGRPILLITVRNHDKHHGDYDTLYKYCLHRLESISNMADERAFDKRMVLIFDLKGFGLSNMDYRFVKELLHVLKTYFPERIATAFIINYPYIFWGCWKIIKYWMNEVTRSKFIFAHENQVNDFIDLSSLPVKLFSQKTK
ncbi:uncharacterized protein [Clytia hemisphaerica]|uniref:uncharacterized protein n=1 Tax=Clytia hemisphaerica TaxID=252671 RepID=UPI0034D78D8B